MAVKKKETIIIMSRRGLCRDVCGGMFEVFFWGMPTDNYYCFFFLGCEEADV